MSSLLVLSLLFAVSSRSRAQATSAVYGLEFTENLGQWGKAFDYRAEVGTGSLFLHSDGFTVVQYNEQDYRRVIDRFLGHTSGGVDVQAPPQPEDSILRGHMYRVYFEGASPSKPSAEGMLQSDINYFIGNDPSRWKSGIRSWSAVTYRDVYPGIDVRYYTYNGQMKYDLIVHPGADASRIRLRYEGVDGLSVKKGELQVRTSVGLMRELEPYTYVAREDGRKELASRYRVDGKSVRFEVEDHDPGARLVIDPTLVFGTFTGSASDNYGYSATPGPDGSLYAAGIVFGTEYPVVPKPGAFQTTFKGGLVDMGITRFSPDGTARLYSTYVGGNGFDIPHSLIADNMGNLVILGRTNSSDYPVKGYLSPSRGGMDIVVTKLDPSGRSLIGSAIIGGSARDGSNQSDEIVINNLTHTLVYNYGDQSRSEVILDDAGNILFVSNTESGNFPVVNAAQSTYSGAQDAVVVKLPPDLSRLLFSTYLGGTAEDAGFCIKIRPGTGEIYVGGPTLSRDFPGSKAGTVGTVPGADVDGYLAVLSPDGSTVVRSTYLATPLKDVVFGLQFDRSGFPYVMGISLGSWPVISATAFKPGSKQFVAKLKPDLSGYEFSTVFGSGGSLPNISPVAFLVDRCERIYVSGWGGRQVTCGTGVGTGYGARTLGPLGMPITPDAIQNETLTDNSDFYIIVLERNASSVLYGTFVGQVGGYGDHVDGGTSRFDARGVIYQAACANCGGNNLCPGNPVRWRFPTTPGAVAAVPPLTATTKKCNLGAFKIALEYSGVQADLEPAANGKLGDSSGCVPLRVDFSDMVGMGKTYIWDFGDGSPRVTTTVPNVSYTYTRTGVFQAKVIATDPSKCVTVDSSIHSIRVRGDKADILFTPTKLPPCADLKYQFVNNSTAPPGKPFGPNAFTWDFGDGTRVNGGSTQLHTYRAPGTYMVKLILNDATSYCNGPDSVSQLVRVSDNVRARFESEDAVCQGLPLAFENTSLGGGTFIWDFGDGSPTYTGPTPPDKVYSTPGTYTVRLVGNDPNTCNLTDQITKQIIVHPNPTAAFRFTPNPSQLNTSTVFSNASIGATRYVWNFGDGNTSAEVNPVHDYVATGSNRVCLEAYNAFGCADTTCQTVASLVSSVLDVANAFTPNGDGVNDKLMVRGFGIVKMDFRIYNRWGQMVFRSDKPSSGWDGTFKGVPQPMEVYGYFLEAEFSTGEKVSRKGDITLLR